MTLVPVHCDCGWAGERLPAKVKARPCPWCDGEVRRFRKLERAVQQKVEFESRFLPDPLPVLLTPLEQEIERKEREWNEPIPRLPNPYYLRALTGEVQVFRIPPGSAGRKHRRRR